MTNAWSFLHETMFGPEDEHNLTIYAPMNNNPNRYKYDEESILKELSDYISGTYNAHYSAGDDKIQTLDLIEACGDGEAFCRSNILKYASRYDKKGTARRDIMKILHYAVLLMHFNDKNAKRETYPQ
jgi:predicted Ser/Thr protein kinase